jgi:hypothetical protein
MSNRFDPKTCKTQIGDSRPPRMSDEEKLDARYMRCHILPEADCDNLYARGIQDAAIDGDAAGELEIRKAKGFFYSGFFVFADELSRCKTDRHSSWADLHAYVRRDALSPVDAYILAIFEGGGICDLLAWDGADRWGLWWGRGAMLGYYNICDIDHGEPLVECYSIEQWLRENRRGIFLLNTRLALIELLIHRVPLIGVTQGSWEADALHQRFRALLPQVGTCRLHSERFTNGGL